jgi:hypothetical protein
MASSWGASASQLAPRHRLQAYRLGPNQTRPLNSLQNLLFFAKRPRRLDQPLRCATIDRRERGSGFAQPEHAAFGLRSVERGHARERSEAAGPVRKAASGRTRSAGRNASPRVEGGT